MQINDPKILGIAFMGGLIPSLLWLWFWLKEDKKNPEPKGLLAIVFLMGMLAVILVLPIQKIIRGFGLPKEIELTAWAATEELIKYLAVILLISKTNQADEPVDWPIYFITVALGFAALENAMFLIKPLSLSQSTVALLTGQLRFLGSTLLHTIASGMIGIAMGISFFMGEITKKIFLLIGFVAAIALHSAFNFFIIKDNGNDFLRVFAFLWVVTIIVLLLFEKVKRMGAEN